MKPHLNNKEIADRTLDILVYPLPSFLKPLGTYFVSYMMDDRLRSSMMLVSSTLPDCMLSEYTEPVTYDPPPRFLSNIFSISLVTRKYFLRHLALPRPYILRYDMFTENPDKNGRNFLLYWDTVPYYVKPTIWNRWSPSAWFRRMMGLPLPGDDGDRFYPQGYKISEVGPSYFEGKGNDQMKEIRNVLAKERRGQCPFS
jgi:hypothetical protein